MTNLKWAEWNAMLGRKELSDGTTFEWEDLPTDPYEHITWAVGSDDDFICFDHGVADDGRVVIHAVINSETAHYIESFAMTWCPPEQAVRAAQGIVDRATEVIFSGDWNISDKQTADSWEQAEAFVDAVRKAYPPKPQQEKSNHE